MTFLTWLALAALGSSVAAIALVAASARAKLRTRMNAVTSAWRKTHAPWRTELRALRDAEIVVVEGTLQLDAPEVVTTEDVLHVALTAQPRDVRIVLPDGELRVTGPVRVVVGSRETLDAISATRAHAAFRGHVPATEQAATYRAIASGDRVLARGRVKEVADPDAAPAGDYRTRAVARELSAPGGEAETAFVALASVKPARAAAAAGRYVTAVVTTLAIVALAGGAFAVTTHGARKVASRCPADLDAQVNRSPSAELARDAEACGDFEHAARAWFAVGDMDGASKAWVHAREGGARVEPTLSEVGVHLLAGRLAEASSAAQLLADVGKVPDASDRRLLACLSDALAARTGNAAARARLTTTTEDAQAPAGCTLLLADMVTGDARASLLAKMPPPKDPYEWPRRDWDQRVKALLLAEGKEAPAPPNDFYPFAALRPKLLVLPVALGLEEAARHHVPMARRHDEAEYARFFAVVDSYFGEHAGARSELERAFALDDLAAWDFGTDAGASFVFRGVNDHARAPTDADLAHRAAYFLAAVLAPRARDTKAARDFLTLAPEESHGRAQLLPVISLVEHGDAASLAFMKKEEIWPPNVALWDAAATHDAAVLVSALKEQHSDGRGVVPFIGAVATTNTQAIDDWARDGVPPPCWSCGVHALADWYAGRREIAQGLGIADVDRTFEARAADLRAALTRRDVAVPVYVLGRVTPM